MLQGDGIEKNLQRKKRLNLTATSNAKAHTLLRNLFFVERIGWRSQYYEKGL